MNLEELRSVQSTERQKDSLQNLRPSFYEEVGEYIADLEAERDAVADRTADPFASPEVARLTDEIETAKDVVEAIYERRMGKLVKQASLAAAGMAADAEGLTAEEQALFDDLVERIETNKHRVLDVLDGRVDTASADDRTATSAPNEPPEPARSAGDNRDSSTGEISPADVMGGEPVDDRGVDGDYSSEQPIQPGEEATTNEPASMPPDDESVDFDGRGEADAEDEVAGGDETDTSGARDAATTSGADPNPEIERLTVQITAEVGSILGVDDREYTLERDDVVTLPAANATPLIDRDAAKPLE